MDTIVKVDPYLPHYIYEKSVNPNAKLVWRQFKEQDVADVDRIVALSSGIRDCVKSARDWEIFGELLNFYVKRFPEEFEEFRRGVLDTRKSRRDKGYSQDKGIMYVGTIPLRFMRIIGAIFPEQEFDKRFVWKMVKRFPVFKITGENNLF